MSTWEERMSQRTKARQADQVAVKRKAFLGDAFLKFWPPDEGAEFGFEPATETLPGIIAARCLGIEYGDPGPPLESNWCRQCWGDRHVWLGNAWGVRHTGGTMSGCGHECHKDEVWLASA